MGRILVVDVGGALPANLVQCLLSDGYGVEIVANPVDALDAVVLPDVGLICLPMGSVGREGPSLIQELRSKSDLPILLITDRLKPDELAEALEDGADSFIAAPFNKAVLLALVRAMLRRSRSWVANGAEPPHLGLTIDFTTRVVRSGRRVIDLTPVQYALLRVLARHAGEVVSSDQIIAALWGDGLSGNNQHLRVQIWQLRRKFETDPSSPKILETVPKHGYRLNLARPSPGTAERLRSS